ncbi:chromosome partition protein Smc [Halalkalicoccus paucihalophilus]|uniref:Chromosome partition protein Smc n=1 Tax=Halalkalicoccus paucihalophilus TaxID=1008153 RepID=A0A151AJ22_9EURY|nr:chromosome segregation protein SMC [Halalkalicoccus paucihalophilus]KYH27510.1 chromosome partition protein Smc [Halalkalicoccus paucihalophilus]
MHIRELVLENFKSFGRKTRIPFYEDFTTVSGPNGSGKSNIIDSVLFALGLSRARGIRAEKLTDLIYNPGHDGEGDAEGPREASVEVVLDNADGTLAREQVVSAAGSEDIGDVETISVRRRVKRTEDNYYSYYYLNDRSVNLSDIQDLLAQAGVTPEGYNVVMQGDVTGIINMTAGQRREIIDEIAGVAEFDAKKDSAFEELETVKERIEEAELRIEEKQDRLDQLADERETALEYKSLREEKSEFEGYLKAAELEEKRAELDAKESRIEEKRETLTDLRRDLDEKQGTVTRLQEDLEDLNAEIERMGEDEQLAIKREIEEVKGEISRFEDKIENSDEAIDEAENDRREAFVGIDRKEETIADLDTEIRETKLEKASVKADIQEKEAEREGVEEKIEDVDTEFDELKADLRERKAALEEARDERNEHQREQDRLLDEARRRSNAISEKEEERESTLEEIPEIEAEIADLEDERGRAAKNREQIDAVVEDLKDEKRELQGTLDELEDDLQAKQGEYAELEAKAGESGDSSYGRAVSTILNAGMDGVHGTVGQLGGVDSRYATACETAAGGRLANVVVDDDGVGQRCIEHLKSRNAGRATFLPMTEMRTRSLSAPPRAEGVVDFAYNLVDFDDAYAGIFSYVLGDTLVVEDIDTARDLMGQYRLVTLEGELVEKSGAMTGGSRSGSRYSFSKSGKGQLERVAEAITDLQDRRESVRADLRDAEGRLESARDRKTEATEQVREIESAIEKKRGAIEEREAKAERLAEEVEELEDARGDVDERMSEIEEEITEATGEIEGLESEIEELEGELADSEIPELTAQLEGIDEEIDGLEDTLDEHDGRLNELQLEKQYAENAIADLDEQASSAEDRIEKQEERIEEFEAGIEEQEALLEEKREAVEELESELAEKKEDRRELRGTLGEATDERDAAKERVGETESRLEGLQAGARGLETDIADLESEVDEYDPEEIPDHDTVEDRIEELTEEMEALEPVNMLAIDEYDRVEGELSTLTDRKQVLVEEREGITDRIESYERQKRETFMDAYRAIDEQFRDIFSRLSAGTGELHLEDEDDPFEGGLTMKAQPADKPIQRLDAMSGGEKSLTALAFIFAIQRYNPAPFYALDEIDAFLDAANAERVGELVDELASEAQFIVVSHRSAMLERSERAIGVTMQGDNVSSVTGIDLAGTNEEAVSADD